MLRTMLVGLDGSGDDDAALGLAIRWASRLDAMVVGLGVVDEPGIQSAGETWLGETYVRTINERLTDEVRRSVDRILERAALRCAGAGVAFKPLEDVGAPSDRILVEAQRFDLILMGQRTHFRFGWEESADDTLRRVLAEAPRPVVACPGRLGPEGRSILIAYDGGVRAARAVQSFRASGLAEGREVHVLCALADRVEAARRADRAVQYLGAHGIAARPIAAPPDPSPSRAILDRLDGLGADLLVMGSDGRPTLREWLVGSTARAVLKDCPVPVFLDH